jgi:hypothetical protein
VPGKTTLAVPLPPHLAPNLHIFIDTLEVDASVVDVDADHRQQHLNHAKDYYQHASYCKTESCFVYLDWVVPLRVGYAEAVESKTPAITISSAEARNLNGTSFLTSI